MGMSKGPIALCALGILSALMPVSLYIMYGQELSIFKTLELEILPGTPIYLLSAFIGLVLTIVGIVLFMRSMRMEAGPPKPQIPQRVPRQAPITRPREVVQTGRQATRPKVEPVEELVKSIEKEVGGLLRSAGEVEAKEPKRVPVEKSSTEIKVITSGFDEVCPSCGAINPLGQKVCQQCGSTIYVEDPSLPSCPVCGAPLKNPTKLSDNVYVCGICFSELEIPEEFSKKL